MDELSASCCSTRWCRAGARIAPALLGVPGSVDRHRRVVGARRPDALAWHSHAGATAPSRSPATTSSGFHLERRPGRRGRGRWPVHGAVALGRAKPPVRRGLLRGFHAYDADLSSRPRSRQRVVVIDLDVQHVTKAGVGDTAELRSRRPSLPGEVEGQLDALARHADLGRGRWSVAGGTRPTRSATAPSRSADELGSGAARLGRGLRSRLGFRPDRRLAPRRRRRTLRAASTKARRWRSACWVPDGVHRLHEPPGERAAPLAALGVEEDPVGLEHGGGAVRLTIPSPSPSPGRRPRRRRSTHCHGPGRRGPRPPRTNRSARRGGRWTRCRSDGAASPRRTPTPSRSGLRSAAAPDRRSGAAQKCGPAMPR